MALKWYGDKVLAGIAEVVDKALLEIGADLQNKSVNRAPVDTGRLRRSFMVDDSELARHKITAGYSPEVDSYSLVQHERLDFNHPKGGEAKYLENPFNENVGRYISNVGRKIGGALK